MKSRKAPPAFLQSIREKVNLLEVVGEHVVLRKTGANYVGLCPFHSERTPSFSVNEQKQLFYCYGCKKGGDLFAFIMEIHGVGFSEAIEELAEKGRLALPPELAVGDPEQEKGRQQTREKMALAYRLNRFVAAFYHQKLNAPASFASLAYVRNRGVDSETLRNFYLGLAVPAWDSLATYLSQKKAPLPLAVELGLIRPSPTSLVRMESSVGYFDLFRNRITFPILDNRGRVVGFGGRSLPSGSGADDGPKYLNSPESLAFQKSKVLFGLYQAQKHIREKDEVILVEGYFDVLALHAAGFRNVVASCGTSLTSDHLALLRRFTGRIILMFDGDRAGVQATERAMELGLENGIVIYGAAMPPDQDPDEVLFDPTSGKPHQGGIEKLNSILSEAKPILDARIEQEIRSGMQSLDARTLALKKIGGWLNKFRDPLGREVRINAVQQQMKIPRALIVQASGGPAFVPGDRKSSAGRGSNANSVPIVETVARPVVNAKLSSPPLSPGDRILLIGLIQDKDSSEIFAETRRKMPPQSTISDLFEHPSLKDFIQSLLDIPGRLDQLRNGPEHFVQGDLDSQVRSVLMEAWVGGESSASRVDLKRTLDRSLSRVWARFSHQIKRAMNEAEVKKNAELHAKLMKDYLDVQRKMKEFNSFYDEA